MILRRWKTNETLSSQNSEGTESSEKDQYSHTPCSESMKIENFEIDSLVGMHVRHLRITEFHVQEDDIGQKIEHHWQCLKGDVQKIVKSKTFIGNRPEDPNKENTPPRKRNRNTFDENDHNNNKETPSRRKSFLDLFH